MGILIGNPFESIDQVGVGSLMKQAIDAGPRARAPASSSASAANTAASRSRVDFFHQIGLDYVSCSPFRVPIARLAAAQAALGEGAERDR